jgi:hypothetical protein
MKFKEISLGEAVSNSCGKTSMPIICGALLILTGCVMGIIAAIIVSNDIALHSLGFATLGSGLLGIRRFTKDKTVSEDAK